MTVYKKGDIVLVPFPFSDQTFIKKRPAVIISSDVYNSHSLDIIIMAVTSNLKNSIMTNECEIKDYSSAGLLKPSIIKSAISTIDKSLVLKRLGSLSSEDSDSLNKILRELLAL
ncbi:MAG: type II toxin-antitoxin system PemK/MazF family toxin [Deltaproteobacteria bacterium]|jgi:mRNA interferase MazF|nr:type II toxin-antitoxin system PemK/MazF family toxin [Deltaproteobacteria bacterium]